MSNLLCLRSCCFRRWLSWQVILLSLLLSDPFVTVGQTQQLAEKEAVESASTKVVASTDESAEVRKKFTKALQNYVQQQDESYGWELESAQLYDSGLGESKQLKLTSQTWQGITWEHKVYVFEPATLKHPEHAILFISGGSTGGKIRSGDQLVGLNLARMTGMRCVILLHVPNQPLMDGKYEDDLISHTFLKYLETKDESWPLLFPMVKSAVRTMDAVQKLTSQDGQPAVKNFIVTGASKRGWTSWLTGAIDPRVVGIAPIVIDTLDIPRQMDHQIATWGKYSEQIADYTGKGLVQVMKEQPDNPLWRWVDPITYQDQLTIPKLIVNGTNDRYWVLDALNVYWDKLQGEKEILYVPNAGHSLKGGQELALRGLAGFSLRVAEGEDQPKWTWKHTQTESELKLEIFCEAGTMKKARLWVAKSPTRDFREAEWKFVNMEATENGFSKTVARPESGHIALYGMGQFQILDQPYMLTTQVHVE